MSARRICKLRDSQSCVASRLNHCPIFSRDGLLSVAEVIDETRSLGCDPSLNATVVTCNHSSSSRTIRDKRTVRIPDARSLPTIGVDVDSYHMDTSGGETV